MLHDAGVPAGLVYQPQDMLEDPHFAARESVTKVKDSRHGALMMQGVVPKFGQTRPSILWPGPALGAHTDAVLSDVLGLDAEEIDRLRKQGAI
jgi:crotonobetainyl-CoA:carnitine CoA-transferase CaiB-like acyl-CoA transferase